MNNYLVIVYDFKLWIDGYILFNKNRSIKCWNISSLTGQPHNSVSNSSYYKQIVLFQIQIVYKNEDFTLPHQFLVDSLGIPGIPRDSQGVHVEWYL